MALPNAYSQYSNSKVLTASPAELTLMLYDGAIKYSNAAIKAMELRDVQKSHDSVIKVQQIIDYLRVTLDMQYPVAQDFDNVYQYLLQRLVMANAKKDAIIMEEVCGHLRSVRDTWKEVMRLNREKGTI